MAYKTVFIKKLGQQTLNGYQLIKIAQDLGCLRTEKQIMRVFLDIATENYPNTEKLFIVLPTQDKIFYMTTDSGCWEYEEVARLSDYFNITKRVVMLVDALQPS